ncbi:hypothetical protein [Methylomagnum ishizawai]|uniref:hypothetical protein n=1 Tax=Methylomagnum ishizawai TaxID=1760988 RepID=UPI001C340709|nr:hypothetical protein [Methylomagnum ishizawai]BBL75447.1 hypothetical protein MishRS11D_25450 [Methylomagnum ishizawai]
MPRHPSVNYSTPPGLSGDYFRCDRLAGFWSVESCAKRWAAATKGGETAASYLSCRNCPIGAAHAGQACDNPEYHRRVCVRCDGPAVARFVHGLYCQSCVNRQYEIAKGRDGRGHPPHPLDIFWSLDREAVKSKLLRVHSGLSLGIVVEGGVVVRHGIAAATSLEAVRVVMHKEPRKVAFCWVPAHPVQSFEPDLFAAAC